MRERLLSAGMIRIHRSGVLKFAAALTMRSDDPTSVAANALPLQEWLESDKGDDQRTRFEALSHAHNNRDYKQRGTDDRPELLIAEAEVFYAFLKGGLSHGD